jgi:hypothetical protein
MIDKEVWNIILFASSFDFHLSWPIYKIKYFQMPGFISSEALLHGVEVCKFLCNKMVLFIKLFAQKWWFSW